MFIKFLYKLKHSFDHFIERVESRHGIHTIEAAAELGFGNREYELINID